MKRRIEEFRQDKEGHWYAILSCGHTQHMRHAPPLSNRPWVLTKAGRRRFLGHELACAYCEGTAAVEKPA